MEVGETVENGDGCMMRRYDASFDLSFDDLQTHEAAGSLPCGVGQIRVSERDLGLS